jgi:hypothetical protein
MRIHSDGSTIRLILACFLCGAGHEVTLADDGERNLAADRATAAEVAVIDPVHAQEGRTGGHCRIAQRNAPNPYSSQYGAILEYCEYCVRRSAWKVCDTLKSRSNRRVAGFGGAGIGLGPSGNWG